MGTFRDLSDMRFSRLRVIERAGHDKYGKILYRCICDCGNEKITLGRSLLNGGCKSCGCLNHDVKIQNGVHHGLAQKNRRLYQIWKGMKARCNRPTSDSYKDYGARGIKICDSWDDNATGFKSFVEWALKNGYQDTLSIDRINNSEGYSPENCRWTDWYTQANNRRRPLMVKNQYGIWSYRNATPLPEPPKEDKL